MDSERRVNVNFIIGGGGYCKGLTDLRDVDGRRSLHGFNGACVSEENRRMRESEELFILQTVGRVDPCGDNRVLLGMMKVEHVLPVR